MLKGLRWIKDRDWLQTIQGLNEVDNDWEQQLEFLKMKTKNLVIDKDKKEKKLDELRRVQMVRSERAIMSKITWEKLKLIAKEVDSKSMNLDEKIRKMKRQLDGI